MNENLPDNPQIQVLKSGTSGLFTNYIYKAIPLAFDESMSYYETLCGLLNYLKNVVIPTVNNNADAVAELQSLYEQLRTYVDDYFTNLDVQQEINNKLDDMTESGELTNIIKNYIDPIYQAYEEEINENIANFKDEVNNDIDEQNTEISNFKLDTNSSLSSMQSQINSVASGSPSGVYATLSELTTDNPDHTKIYVVEEDGKWYYYNTTLSSWVAGGIYQASINTINVEELNDIIQNMPLNADKFNVTWQMNKYVNSNGEIVNYSAAPNNFGIVILQADESWKEIITNAVSGVAGYIAFYNENDTLISVEQYNNTNIKTINIPDNTSYIYITNKFDDPNPSFEIKQPNPYITINSGLFTFELNTLNETDNINEKIDNTNEEIDKIKYKLNNKKISVMGDSISTFTGLIPSGANSQYPDQDVLTFDDTWIGMLINKTNATLEQLNSYGGSRITNTGSITPFVDNNRINALGNPDIIIVFGGVNDMYQNNTELGELPNIYNTSLNDYNKATFKSAYLYLLTKLKETYPSAKIYSCGILDYTRDTTSFYFKNTSGLSKQIVNESIKECCDIAGIKYIDLLKCGISYFNYTTYSDDQFY